MRLTASFLSAFYACILVLLGNAMLTNCSDSPIAEEPVKEEEQLNIPRLSFRSELLDEPKRGLNYGYYYDGVADGFEIQRKVNDSSFQSLINFGANQEEDHEGAFQDWDIEPYMYYTYRIRAVKGNETSEWSIEAGRAAPEPQPGLIEEIDCIADTYIDESFPDKNFGDGEWLHITKDGNLEYEGYQAIKAYLKFTLADIPEYTLDVKLAEVRVIHTYPRGPTMAFPYLDSPTSDWDEDTLTWNNKPPDLIGAAGLKPTFYTEGNNLYLINITSAVHNWVIDKKPNYGIILKAPPGNINTTRFLSREYHFENSGPQLTVYYTW